MSWRKGKRKEGSRSGVGGMKEFFFRDGPVGVNELLRAPVNRVLERKIARELPLGRRVQRIPL